MAQTGAGKVRLLFVDDEDSIRLTMPRILEMHGFEVIVCSTVPEALAAVQRQEFDVLLADLNVGQPGDGFTIVSAMRRTQPEAVTLILTGYPAFDTALEAIRKQVDGYIVKPTDVDHLLSTIKTLLNTKTPHPQISARRVAQLLAERSHEVVVRWVAAVRSSTAMRSGNVASASLENDARHFVSWLVQHIENGRPQPSNGELAAAREHGRKRKQQHYSLPMLLEETHLLRQDLLRTVEENLLVVEISYVVTDLATMNNIIDAMLSAAVEGYLEEGKR